MRTEKSSEKNAGTLFIGDACVELEVHRITIGNKTVKVQPRVMHLLFELMKADGGVVPRDALFAAVWADEVPNDEALTKAISKLRKALGDQAHAPRYIETIPKVGYRLIAPVASEHATLKKHMQPVRPPRRWRLMLPQHREPWLWGLVACLLVVILVLSINRQPTLPLGLTADMKPRILRDSTHQMMPPRWAYRISPDSTQQRRRRRPHPSGQASPSPTP